MPFMSVQSFFPRTLFVPPPITDLYVAANTASQKQYFGNWGLPQAYNNVSLDAPDYVALVATSVSDVFSNTYSNSMMALTNDGGIFLGGNNYLNLLNPYQSSAAEYYAVYNDVDLGLGWSKFAKMRGNDGAQFDMPPMIQKQSDGLFYEWGGYDLFYGDGTNPAYTVPTATPFNDTFTFVNGAEGITAYNGTESWFIGTARWFADMGTIEDPYYVTNTWERIVGLPFEPTQFANSTYADFVLMVDHADQLWYKYRVDPTPTLLATDVKHLVWSCGDPAFGFINSAGELWIINSSIISNSTSLHTISPSDPLTDNFHMLQGGPYKSAIYSDWSIGLVAIDTNDDAWLFGWEATAWWQSGVAPTKQIIIGKPVQKVVPTYNAMFIIA